MDTEIQSSVLYDQHFSFRYVWRDDEYALFCICTGIQCSVDSDRNDLFQEEAG